MSAPADCCQTCTTPETVGVPGSTGTNGVNAYTVTTANFIVPADRTTPVTVSVANTSWMASGQYIFIDGPGHFKVNGAPPSATQVSLLWQNAQGDVAAGSTISSGAKVSPSGKSPLAVITAITDNSGGTVGDTFAAGVGIETVCFPIQLASMTNAAADLMTNYTPGYRFKVLAMSFTVTTLGTGAGASQVLNLEIGSTNLTGGVLTLTLANSTPLGNLVAATAITANNVGTSSDTLSLEVAGGGTVFTAGAGLLLVKLQNMDTADAFASIADKLNDVIDALS